MKTLAGELKDLEPIVGAFPEVKLAYLFGSRARGDAGPLADYDFAVYLDEPDAVKRFDLKLRLMGVLTRKLKTDRVDVCVLNDIRAPELKYEVLRDGILFLEREPFKVLVEPRILNEYFDFHYSLVKNGLTKDI